MKVETQSVLPKHTPPHVHQPHTKAQAHGLVRQLQEDTFNGASAEKHRARYAERLTESPAAMVADPSIADVVPGDEATNVSLLETPVAVPTAHIGDGSPLDLVDPEYASLNQAILENAPAAPQWYEAADPLHLLDGIGQEFDWTA